MDRGTQHGGCPGAHSFPNQPYPSQNLSHRGTVIESLFPCQYDEVKLCNTTAKTSGHFFRIIFSILFQVFHLSF